jgi:site-specific DNA-methyltransferase (adenine-specific)
VVTDPPYGIDFAHGGGGSQKIGNSKSRRNVGGIIGDKEPFDPSHLLTFPEAIMFGADHFYARLPDSGRFLAWDKKKGWDFTDNCSDVEFAWHSEEGASRIINYLWKGVRQDGEKGLPKYHVMQKPIAVMEWCIGQLKGPGQVILDPYMGSGSTGVAAVKLGRQFIGVEKDPKHFDVACFRILQSTKQTDLFIEKPKPAKQEALL